jgi:hypothetical protein
MKRTYRRFGRKIKDSSAPLTIRVRPVDIKGAVCRDHERCVIANAIKRSKRAPWVDVGADTVIVGDTEKTGRRFKLDSLGKEVVRYFDTSEGGAGPTQLILRPPASSQRIGARHGEKHGSNRRSGRRRKPTR